MRRIEPIDTEDKETKVEDMGNGKIYVTMFSSLEPKGHIRGASKPTSAERFTILALLVGVGLTVSFGFGIWWTGIIGAITLALIFRFVYHYNKSRKVFNGVLDWILETRIEARD